MLSNTRPALIFLSWLSILSAFLRQKNTMLIKSFNMFEKIAE